MINQYMSLHNIMKKFNYIENLNFHNLDTKEELKNGGKIKFFEEVNKIKKYQEI